MENLHTTNVMIDPSLILAENSIANTFDQLRQLSKGENHFRFYYPLSLRELLSSHKWDEKSSGIRFFLKNARPSDPVQLSKLLGTHSSIVQPFEFPSEYRRKYAGIYKGLIKELEYRGELHEEALIEILFEEFIFLQEQSCVVSRIKKSFNRIGNAGVATVQVCRRALDELARRSPRPPKQGEPITDVVRLKYLGKWIAVVVGSPMLASIHPWLASLPNLVWIFDPEAEAG